MSIINPAERLHIKVDKEGILISPVDGVKLKVDYRLRFDNNQLEQIISSGNIEESASFYCYGLIGKVDYGPGFLFLIIDREVVANIYEKNIYRIKKIIAIPLDYDLAVEKIKRNIASNNLSVEEEEEVMGEEEKEEEVVEESDNTDTTDDIDNDEELVKIITADCEQYETEQENTIRLKRSISVLEDELHLGDTNILTSVLLKEPPRWKKWFSKKSRDKNDSKKITTSSELVGKFVNTIKRLFSSGSFYYAYDIDLTNSLSATPNEIYPFNNIRNVFFFNNHLSKEFKSTSLVLPIIQGFIGHCTIPLDIQTYNENSDSIPQIIGDIFLFSRRSTKRAGVRYLRRGIDDNGNCANWVETEQIIQLPVQGELATCSFTQVRGSIPVYFSQSPYKLQPTPKVLKRKEETVDVFLKHFQNLQQNYGEPVGISLVEKSPSRESMVGDLYKQLADENNVYLEWFDFHRVCKGLKFNQVDTIFDSNIGKKLDEFGWTDSYNHTKQKGIFRINCIDCLDRTNVLETSIGKKVLRAIISRYNFNFDDWKLFEKDFNNVWADNGDAISQQYSSTNALKGDFTRTSQRNYKGVLNDAFLTLSRYFYGMVTDFFMQTLIDYILGNVDEGGFDDFEENMENRDSLVNLGSVRSSAIEAACSIVLSDNEVLYGGWWLLTPQKGDIRNAELKDTVVLVSDSAVYICDIDLDAEKVVNYHRIPSKCIITIQQGSFFGEILSQASRNPSRNRGILLKYNVKGVTSASDGTSSSVNLTRSSTPVIEEPSQESFIAIKIPSTQIDEVEQVLTALKQCCHNVQILEKDIVTFEEANSNTGVWDILEYYMKRAVWG